MKKFLLNYVQPVVGTLFLAFVFIHEFLASLHGGFFYALFSALFLTCLVILLIGLIFILGWKLFTKEGRESEEIAQARYEIRKLEKKREREWKRMNRGW